MSSDQNFTIRKGRPEYDIWKPQIHLNLVYLPLDTGGYQSILRLYYATDNANPLIPLFLEEV